MKKIRLDQKVYDLGFAESREKAKAIVMSGVVFVNGQRSDKPGNQIPEDAQVEVRGKTLPFVSRGGYKLDKALRIFTVNVQDKVCIDCGASTGGFTDVLLQNGARKVYSVDVGYGQLAWKLRSDPRVINMESTNLRYVTSEQIPEPIEIAVMDVSFISIRLLIPVVKSLLIPGGDFICLIKPQFEAGRQDVGKKGVVRDKAVHVKVVEEILACGSREGFTVMGLDYSPIRGPEGNIEYICHFVHGNLPGITPDVKAIVEASHNELN